MDEIFELSRFLMSRHSDGLRFGNSQKTQFDISNLKYDERWFEIFKEKNHYSSSTLMPVRIHDIHSWMTTPPSHKDGVPQVR